MAGRRLVLAGAPGERDAVHHADEQPGEFSGACNTGERAVDDEHHSADGDASHGDDGDSHFVSNELIRARIRMALPGMERLPDQRRREETIEAENGAGRPNRRSHRTGRKVDQTGERARGQIDSRERQAADEALEDHAKLGQDRDID